MLVQSLCHKHSCKFLLEAANCVSFVQTSNNEVFCCVLVVCGDKLHFKQLCFGTVLASQFPTLLKTVRRADLVVVRSPVGFAAGYEQVVGVAAAKLLLKLSASGFKDLL